MYPRVYVLSLLTTTPHVGTPTAADREKELRCGGGSEWLRCQPGFVPRYHFIRTVPTQLPTYLPTYQPTYRMVLIVAKPSWKDCSCWLQAVEPGIWKGRSVETFLSSQLIPGFAVYIEVVGRSVPWLLVLRIGILAARYSYDDSTD